MNATAQPTNGGAKPSGGGSSMANPGTMVTTITISGGDGEVKTVQLRSPSPTSETRLTGTRQARLVVELPADAKLSIDDYLTRDSTKTTRTFTTPELEPGQDYYYTLRLEMTRDGRTVVATRRVIVRAGREVRTVFDDVAIEETVSAAIGR
jgi:uncharacterized protein (TIGR03000 family)